MRKFIGVIVLVLLTLTSCYKMHEPVELTPTPLLYEKWYAEVQDCVRQSRGVVPGLGFDGLSFYKVDAVTRTFSDKNLIYVWTAGRNIYIDKRFLTHKALVQRTMLIDILSPVRDAGNRAFHDCNPFDST